MKLKVENKYNPRTVTLACGIDWKAFFKYPNDMPLPAEQNNDLNFEVDFKRICNTITTWLGPITFPK